MQISPEPLSAISPVEPRAMGGDKSEPNERGGGIDDIAARFTLNRIL